MDGGYINGGTTRIQIDNISYWLKHIRLSHSAPFREQLRETWDQTRKWSTRSSMLQYWLLPTLKSCTFYTLLLCKMTPGSGVMLNQQCPRRASASDFCKPNTQSSQQYPAHQVLSFEVVSSPQVLRLPLWSSGRFSTSPPRVSPAEYSSVSWWRSRALIGHSFWWKVGAIHPPFLKQPETK